MRAAPLRSTSLVRVRLTGETEAPCRQGATRQRQDAAQRTNTAVARASRTAYASPKHGVEKVGDNWEAKDRKGPTDAQAAKSGAAAGAAVAVCARHSWGYAAPPVKSGEVKALRAELTLATG